MGKLTYYQTRVLADDETEARELFKVYAAGLGGDDVSITSCRYVFGSFWEVYGISG